MPLPQPTKKGTVINRLKRKAAPSTRAVEKKRNGVDESHTKSCINYATDYGLLNRDDRTYRSLIKSFTLGAYKRNFGYLINNPLAIFRSYFFEKPIQDMNQIGSNLNNLLHLALKENTNKSAITTRKYLTTPKEIRETKENRTKYYNTLRSQLYPLVGRYFVDSFNDGSVATWEREYGKSAVEGSDHAFYANYGLPIDIKINNKKSVENNTHKHLVNLVSAITKIARKDGKPLKEFAFMSTPLAEQYNNYLLSDTFPEGYKRNNELNRRLITPTNNLDRIFIEALIKTKPTQAWPTITAKQWREGLGQERVEQILSTMEELLKKEIAQGIVKKWEQKTGKNTSNHTDKTTIPKKRNPSMAAKLEHGLSPIRTVTSSKPTPSNSNNDRNKPRAKRPIQRTEPRTKPPSKRRKTTDFSRKLREQAMQNPVVSGGDGTSGHDPARYLFPREHRYTTSTGKGEAANLPEAMTQATPPADRARISQEQLAPTAVRTTYLSKKRPEKRLLNGLLKKVQQHDKHAGLGV